MKRKVLVIDDEAESLLIYEKMLRKAGYGVVTASTGWKGIDIAIRDRPDLVLLDLMLPDITGLTVLETVHASPSTKDIPVIVVSAISKDDDVIKAMQIGALDYIIKPIGYDDLVRRIEEVFSSCKQKTEGSEAPVLIVENDSADTEPLSKQLLSWGYQPLVVRTGREAVSRSVTGNFDIIILDRFLPDMDGFDAVTDIRNAERLRTTPIIMVMNNPTSEDRRKAYESGVDEFMNKQVSYDNLRCRMHTLTLVRGMPKQRFILSEMLAVIGNAMELVEATEMYHNQKVSSISVIVGKKMGLRGHDLWILEMSGLLHDVGKLGIRKEILTKAGKLDSAEWDEMRRHSEYGERIIEPLREFGEITATVRHHHEKINGSGYPDGLREDDVSQYVRIVGVADSYEALTSDRLYRPAFTRDEAMDILRKETEQGLWDQKVIDALASSLDDLDNL